MFELEGTDYSLEQLQEAANKYENGDFQAYLAKMKKKGLVEKTKGVPAVDASVTPQTVLSGTELASVDGLSESQSVNTKGYELAGNIPSLTLSSFNEIVKKQRGIAKEALEIDSARRDIQKKTGLNPHQYPKLKVGEEDTYVPTGKSGTDVVKVKRDVLKTATLEETQSIVSDINSSFNKAFEEMLSSELEELIQLQTSPDVFKRRIGLIHERAYNMVGEKHGLSKDGYAALSGMGLNMSGLFVETLNKYANKQSADRSTFNIQNVNQLDNKFWEEVEAGLISNLSGLEIKKKDITASIRDAYARVNDLVESGAGEDEVNKLLLNIDNYKKDIQKLSVLRESQSYGEYGTSPEIVDEELASSYIEDGKTKYRESKISESKELVSKTLEVELSDLKLGLSDFEAEEKLLKSKALNLQRLHAAGSEQTVKLDIAKTTGTSLYRNLKELGYDFGETGFADVPLKAIFDAGFDGRDFEPNSEYILASFDVMKGAMSEEDRAKLLHYEKSVYRTKAEVELLYKMVHVNIDPASMDRGGGIKMFFQKGLQSTATHFTDMSQEEADIMFSKGRGYSTDKLLEVFQGHVEDFNSTYKSEIALGEVESIDFTKEQLEALEKTLGEQVGEGVGHFVPMLVELGVLSAGTGWAMNVTRATQFLNKMKNAGGWGKVLNHASYAMLEEGKMYLADMGAGTGAGFYAGGQLTRGVTPFKKRFKYLDPIFQKVVKGGPVGAASSQIAHVANTAAKDLMDDVDFSRSIEEHFGHLEYKDVLVEAIVFSIVGVTHAKKSDFMSTGRKYEAIAELVAEQTKLPKDVEKMSTEQKERWATLEQAKQTLQQQIMVETNVENLDPSSKTYERDLNSRIVEPMNAAISKVMPEYTGFEVKLVNNTVYEALSKSPGSKAEYQEAKDGGKHKILFNKDKISVEDAAQKINHEITHAATEAYFRANPEMMTRFTNKMMDLFKDFDFTTYDGTKLGDFIAEAYGKRSEGGIDLRTGKGQEVANKEFLAYMVELLTDPKIYHQKVAPNFFSDAKQELLSIAEEKLGLKPKIKTAKDFVELLARFGQDARRGLGISAKASRLANLDEFDFLGIEFIKNNKEAQVEVLASKELVSEKKRLVEENKRLFEKKPDGYEAKMKENIVIVKGINEKLKGSAVEAKISDAEIAIKTAEKEMKSGNISIEEFKDVVKANKADATKGATAKMKESSIKIQNIYEDASISKDKKFEDIKKLMKPFFKGILEPKFYDQKNFKEQAYTKEDFIIDLEAQMAIMIDRTYKPEYGKPLTMYLMHNLPRRVAGLLEKNISKIETESGYEGVKEGDVQIEGEYLKEAYTPEKGKKQIVVAKELGIDQAVVDKAAKMLKGSVELSIEGLEEIMLDNIHKRDILRGNTSVFGKKKRQKEIEQLENDNIELSIRIDEAKQAVSESSGKKVDLYDIGPKSIPSYKNIVGAYRESIEKDIVVDFFGVDQKVYDVMKTTAAKNLSGTQMAKVKRVVEDNVETMIKLLPQGAQKIIDFEGRDVTPDVVRDKATGLQTVIEKIELLYQKNPARGKDKSGAGLAPYVMSNALVKYSTTKDLAFKAEFETKFLQEFGIGEGAFTGRNLSQRLKGLMEQTGKAVFNQSIREAIKTDKGLEAYFNVQNLLSQIAAGKSGALASKSLGKLAKDMLSKGSKESTWKDYALLLEGSRFEDYATREKAELILALYNASEIKPKTSNPIKGKLPENILNSPKYKAFVKGLKGKILYRTSDQTMETLVENGDVGSARKVINFYIGTPKEAMKGAKGRTIYHIPADKVLDRILPDWTDNMHIGPKISEHTDFALELFEAHSPVWKLSEFSKFAGDVVEANGGRARDGMEVAVLGGIDAKDISILNTGYPVLNPRILSSKDIGKGEVELSTVAELAKKLGRDPKLHRQLNETLEDKFGIESTRIMDKSEAESMSMKADKFQLFIPHSAADFELLIEPLWRKGKKGIEDKKWWEDNFQEPWERGARDIDATRQKSLNDYKALRKKYKNVISSIGKEAGRTKHTNDAAIRVYLWSKYGMKIPGLKEANQKMIIKYVMNNPEIKAFADGLSSIIKHEEGYFKPSSHWRGETIASDVSEVGFGYGRKRILKDWLEVKSEVFSEVNLNKMESKMGTKWREAMDDMLYRMETGKSRPKNLSSDASTVINWINNSVGAVMFFNNRSATMQLLSTVNFVNHAENNPLAAAKAFANQPQFWKDFVRILQSDMLKQRREGLQIDVSHAELAASVGKSKSPIMAGFHYVLKKGFLPTQIADSFAISMGGATYYRNRVKAYVKSGKSTEVAEELAWLDFQKVAQKTQQSSRPDLISQEQAGLLGRLILAFANTPMQMNRIMKKDMKDIINGRFEGVVGDNSITNKMSRIGYYGFVQSAIFAGLSSGLFALQAFGDDSVETKTAIKKKEIRAANGMVNSFLRGMGWRGATTAGVLNAILEFYVENPKGWNADFDKSVNALQNISPTLGSKQRKLHSAGKTYKYNREVIPEMTDDFGDVLYNPAVHSVANVVSGTTNIPLDRVVLKAQNISDALDSSNEDWQRVLLFMGFNRWDLGIKDEHVEEAKESLKKKKELDGFKGGGMDYEGKVRCVQIKSSGLRCKNICKPGDTKCYAHK